MSGHLVPKDPWDEEFCLYCFDGNCRECAYCVGGANNPACAPCFESTVGAGIDGHQCVYEDGSGCGACYEPDYCDVE